MQITIARRRRRVQSTPTMYAYTLSSTLNNRISDFGHGIFEELAEATPSVRDTRYWNGKMMQLSMSDPDLKTDLFRLVDVLPALRSQESIAEHVREYLGRHARKLHNALGWGLDRITHHALGARLTSFFLKFGVQQMANVFIAGSTPDEALPVLSRLRRNRYAFTVDLLGEFCVCEEEAEGYLKRYLDALRVFGPTVPLWPESAPCIPGHPGETSAVCISVKLTALYSQTNVLNFERSITALSERLTLIAREAKRHRALLYVDAEDSGNNGIIYETFKRVFSSPEFCDFPYPGIVIQAYSRNSSRRVEEMLTFARQRGAPIAIRLVKGAYWDYERVISAQNHWEFPLWSHKESSDAQFEHLSRVLLDNHELCLPAFGSHNIRSLSHACCYAEEIGLSPKDFEVQVLYGMAEPIAQAFSDRGYLVRMYVPLGELLPGMGYLVRRLLENTSNESFLRHTFFDAAEVGKLLREPQMREVAA